MGGMHSPHYARFKSLCYTGFTSLRKNANLIINLVALMVDANIPDIKLEPDKAVLKVRRRRVASRRLGFFKGGALMGVWVLYAATGPGQVLVEPFGGGRDQGV